MDGSSDLVSFPAGMAGAEGPVDRVSAAEVVESLASITFLGKRHSGSNSAFPMRE